MYRDYSVRRYLEEYDRLDCMRVEGQSLKKSKDSTSTRNDGQSSENPAWLLPLALTNGALEEGFRAMALSRDLASSISPRHGSSGQSPGVYWHRNVLPALPPVAKCPSLSSGSSSAGDTAVPQQQYHEALPLRPSRSPSSNVRTIKASSKSVRDPINHRSSGPSRASAYPPCVVVDGRFTEPALYKSIRTILANDPSFTNLLLTTIEELPQHKRDILLADDAPSDGADKKTPASAGQTNVAFGRGGSGSSSSSSRTIKKRAASSQGQRDRDSGDEEGSTGGGGHRGPPIVKQQKLDEVQLWICPFCHAFQTIDRIPRFKTCRPFGNLKSRKIWREHLERKHSPAAAVKDDQRSSHAHYYMSEDTWAEVEQIILSAGGSRPRKGDEKLDGNMACFINVWRRIFPKTHHPTLKEPTSPFWSVQPSHDIIEERLQTMLEAILAATAKAAVNDGIIAEESDFTPTQQGFMDISKTALTILTTMSDTMSKALVSKSDADIQTAVDAQLGASSDETPLPELPEDEDEEEESSTEPTARSVARPAAKPAAKPAVVRSASPALTIIPIPLNHQDVDVHLHLVSTDGRKPGLRVTIPPGTALKSFSQDESRPPVTHNTSFNHVHGGMAMGPRTFSPPMPQLDAASVPGTLNPICLTRNTGDDDFSQWLYTDHDTQFVGFQ